MTKTSQLTDDYCTLLKGRLRTVGEPVYAAANLLIAHTKALQAIIDDLANGDHDEPPIDPAAVQDADDGDSAGNVNTKSNNGHPMDRFPADVTPGFAGDVETSKPINDAELLDAILFRGISVFRYDERLDGNVVWVAMNVPMGYECGHNGLWVEGSTPHEAVQLLDARKDSNDPDPGSTSQTQG